MIRYVGIDLHKHLLVAHILDEQGNTLSTARCEPLTHVTLERFAQKYLCSEDHVALEATSHVWAVVRFLERYVARVVVSNPLATKAIASAKVKTDKVDAQVLAHLLRLDYLPSVWRPSPELSLLRELSSRRSRLVQDRTKLICRIRSVLAMRLLHCPHEIPSPLGRAWLANCELDEQGRCLIQSDARLLDALQAEIDAVEKQLAQRTWQDEAVKLLMTLPGVSITVATAVVAAIGSIDRFESPEKLASYLGLTPSTHQSAAKCYHGAITKAGNVQARTALVQAAHTAARDNGPLGHFFARVRRRKNYNVAIVATARKLAMLAWHLLWTRTPYRYAKPASVEYKLAKLRVAGSGERRKGGLGKGIDPRTAHAPEEQHQRRTGSLAEVLRKEQLAAPDATSAAELKAGERRMLESIGQLAYFESLHQASVRPKRGSPGGRESLQPEAQSSPQRAARRYAAEAGKAAAAMG